MAYAYSNSPEEIHELACVVCPDRERTALKMSSLLSSMPTNEGRNIAFKTLASSGFSNLSAQREEFDEFKNLLKKDV